MGTSQAVRYLFSGSHAPAWEPIPPYDIPQRLVCDDGAVGIPTPEHGNESGSALSFSGSHAPAWEPIPPYDIPQRLVCDDGAAGIPTPEHGDESGGLLPPDRPDYMNAGQCNTSRVVIWVQFTHDG